MSKLEVLSVSEDNYKSNCISARQVIFNGKTYEKFYISINDDKQIHISAVGGEVKFTCIDIDGIIEYLQEVKQFLSEIAVMNELIGRK
jgi:hypothetical protein